MVASVSEKQRGLQPSRCKQYVSPKRWHLPTGLHGAKTQKDIIIISNIIITAVKTRVSLTSTLVVDAYS
jgi:hypothetical protein